MVEYRDNCRVASLWSDEVKPRRFDFRLYGCEGIPLGNERDKARQGLEILIAHKVSLSCERRGLFRCGGVYSGLGKSHTELNDGLDGIRGKFEGHRQALAFGR